MRVNNWALRLTEYLMRVRTERHRLDWANHSCCSFAAGAVEAITGENPHTEVAGQYATAEEAIQVLKDLGYSSLDQYLREHYHEVPIVMAQKGDLVLVTAENADGLPRAMRLAIGVCDPPVFWALGENGLSRGRMSDVVMAFKV